VDDGSPTCTTVKVWGLESTERTYSAPGSPMEHPWAPRTLPSAAPTVGTEPQSFHIRGKRGVQHVDEGQCEQTMRQTTRLTKGFPMMGEAPPEPACAQNAQRSTFSPLRRT
jgi:hypothetical protein